MFKFVEEFEYAPDEAPINLKISSSIETDYDDPDGNEHVVVRATDEDGNSEDILSISPKGVVTLMHIGQVNALNLPVSKAGKIKVAR